MLKPNRKKLLHQEMLNNKAVELETFIKISKLVISNSSLEEILNTIVKTVAEITGSKMCLIILFNGGENKLYLKASYGLKEEYHNRLDLILGENIGSIIVEEKRPVAVMNISEDNRFISPEIAQKESLCSMLAVPMILKDKVTGVICLYTAQVRKFAESEIDKLQTIANQTVMVVENSNLLKRAVDAEEALESRKLIERAKGILMKTQGMDEDDAYRTIHRKSMDMRRSMKEIAEAIILSNEIRRK